jgi:hypothetical protein
MITETVKTYESAEDIMLKAEVPIETRTYKPISHRQLVDLTLESVLQSGFTVDKQKYSVGSNGNVASGRYTISNVKDEDMQLQIAWQNSYDKTTTLKFAIGVQVFICSNGMVSGDHGSFAEKHMGGIQQFAASTITEYIKRSGDAFTKMQQDKEAFKAHEISKERRAELLGLMFAHDKFLKSTQLNMIQREFTNPTHDYKSPNTLWELYNYVTFAMKEIHPTLWMKNHIKCHDFFAAQADLEHEKIIHQIQPANQLIMEI